MKYYDRIKPSDVELIHCDAVRKPYDRTVQMNASSPSDSSSPASSSPSSPPSLDLPSSFDDTLDLSEIINAEGSSTNAKGVRLLAATKKSDDDSTEVRLLGSKLHEAAATIQSLRTQIQSAKLSLQELDIDFDNDDEDYQHLLHLSKLPPEQQQRQGGELSIVDHAVLILRQKVAIMRKKLDREKREAQNTADMAEADLAEAARVRKVAERRITGMEETLQLSQHRNDELEGTVQHLQDRVIDLKEKGRMYDATCRRASSAEEDLGKMRLSLTNYSEELKESSSKLSECQQRVQNLERDNSYLERERAVLVCRAEASEKKSVEQASQLREALTNAESLQLQNMKQQKSIKSSYDARLVEETARLRSASEKETSLVKANITAQLDRAREDFVKTQSAQEQQKRAIIDVEKQLSDAQSDVKIKTYENKSLLDNHQSVLADLKSTKEQVQQLQLDHSSAREELSKLRLETDTERKQLRDEIAKKDEQLEAYLLLELKVDSSVQAGKYPGSAGLLSDPKRRIEQAVMLAKQVAELKRNIESLQSKLRTEQETTASLKAKLEASERAVAQLNHPSAYVVRSAKVREEELQRLRAENKTLQSQLGSSQNEKRQLSHQLSDVLDRRQQIEEVKTLVQDLRKERQAAVVAAPKTYSNAGAGAGVGVGASAGSLSVLSMNHNLAKVGVGDDQDWMIHTIHHATSSRNRIM